MIISSESKTTIKLQIYSYIFIQTYTEAGWSPQGVLEMPLGAQNYKSTFRPDSHVHAPPRFTCPSFAQIHMSTLRPHLQIHAPPRFTYSRSAQIHISMLRPDSHIHAPSRFTYPCPTHNYIFLSPLMGLLVLLA